MTMGENNMKKPRSIECALLVPITNACAAKGDTKKGKLHHLDVDVDARRESEIGQRFDNLL